MFSKTNCSMPKQILSNLLQLTLTLCILGFAGCGIVTPDIDCADNHTGKLNFKNKSSRSTYIIVLNNARIGTIKAGKSKSRTVFRRQPT